MKRNLIAPIAVGIAVLMISFGAGKAEQEISSKIAASIESQLPKASGISASIPLLDLPENLVTDSIKRADINIDNYALKGSNTNSSLSITARNISKKQPTIVGSLEIKATIPAKTILENAQFENARIIGRALQISVGVGGLGEAMLTPRFTNNQIFFQLDSVSIFGNKIPAETLPADIQSQIKSKSMRSIDIPKSLRITSVTMSSKGLSVYLKGSRIKFGNFGSSL